MLFTAFEFVTKAGCIAHTQSFCMQTMLSSFIPWQIVLRQGKKQRHSSIHECN